MKNRYLLAIEDPFEIDHNVARTVIHDGIVSIRDEFRRAWGILQRVGQGHTNVDDLFEPSLSLQPPVSEKEAEPAVDGAVPPSAEGAVQKDT